MDGADGPVFQMHGARSAIAAGLGHIERQVVALEAAVSDNAGLVFDLARTLVESVCRTVLHERGIEYQDTDDLPQLFRAVGGQLPMLPPEASTEAEARKSLLKTLGGLQTTIQGICELRNAYGFASHGAGEPRSDLETAQSLLVAEAADAIVGFLYRMHSEDRTIPVSPHAEFAASEDYNAWIDEEHPIRIFDSDFRASEVLFQLEPETYRIYRADFVSEGDDGAAAIR